MLETILGEKPLLYRESFAQEWIITGKELDTAGCKQEQYIDSIRARMLQNMENRRRYEQAKHGKPMHLESLTLTRYDYSADYRRDTGSAIKLTCWAWIVEDSKEDRIAVMGELTHNVIRLADLKPQKAQETVLCNQCHAPLFCDRCGATQFKE